MKKDNVLVLIITLAILWSIAGIFLLYSNSKEGTTDIKSFEDCKQAGYPIMESYPERCMTSDGRSFDDPNQ